jgi:acyl-CoA thioester hydrolase
MFRHETTLRVRYAETDQMNIVYYGNYAQYFEVGRVEAIRSLGMSYKSLEEKGVLLPVVELNVRYLRSAQYDDLLTIRSEIRDLPTDHRITFHQEVYNEDGKLLTSGTVLLYFLDAKTRKRVTIPQELQDSLSPFFIADEQKTN